MNDKNAKMDNKNYVLLTLILFAILILLIIYILDATKKSGVNLNNDKKINNSVAYNVDEEQLSEAKSLLYKYIDLLDSPNFCNPFNTGFTDECKVYIAYKNLSESDYMITNCNALYNDITDNYVPSIGGYCNLNSTISYDVLNNSYKNLFGLDLTLEKSDYNFNSTYLNYKDIIDSFINIEFKDYEKTNDYIKYEITDVTKNDDKFTVIVAYSLVNYDGKNYHIKLNNNEIVDFNDEDFNNYVNDGLVDKYAFEFAIVDNQKYLTDFSSYFN